MVGCGLFSFSRLYSWSGAIISIFGAFAALSIVIFKFVMDNMECYERFGYQIVLQKVPSEANPKVCNHGEGPY